MRLLPLILISAASLARADEGMWTFDNIPTSLLQQQYHFTPSKAWLDHVRLASVRLNDGGSGSFVSEHGLLLTNHHVARGQLQKNSTAEHNYLRDGFYAETADKELRSPDLEVDVLQSMENVTAGIEGALRGATNAEKASRLRRETIARIERESLEKTGLRSDVVSLYQGGEYWLYRYKKYTDVRLVFAPEQEIAFFGGDPDNFTYPRYDLDMAIFRVYDNGSPLQTKDYLKWNSKGAATNELVFVSGHPGSTSRNDTMAQLITERDIREPLTLALLSQRIRTLEEYSATGAEPARQAFSRIFNFQNGQKAFLGRYDALKAPSVIAKKQAEEKDFQTKLAAHSEWQKEYGSAWNEIATVQTKAAALIKPMMFRRLDSQLLAYASQIVQYVVEVAKPDGERLPGFHDSQLESVRFALQSPAPVSGGLDEARLTGSLTESLRQLGANDEYLRIVLNGGTPQQVAQALVRGTKLGDPEFRKTLLADGARAVDASNDPMIVLARKLDPLSRQLQKQYEREVTDVERAAGEKLGKARFLVYGKTIYPDATFTLRLSYGTVKSYPMNGTKAPPFTTFYGLYDRALGFGDKDPFHLPERYEKAKATLNLATPMNFVSTCDIIGGNSGSPVMNKEGELVGLIFDGNIESLAGDFVYEGETNRAVAVHSAAMMETLRNLYGAKGLADELSGVTH